MFDTVLQSLYHHMFTLCPNRLANEVGAVVRTSAFYPGLLSKVLFHIDYGFLTLAARALCWYTILKLFNNLGIMREGK